MKVYPYLTTFMQEETRPYDGWVVGISFALIYGAHTGA